MTQKLSLDAKCKKSIKMDDETAGMESTTDEIKNITAGKEKTTYVKEKTTTEKRKTTEGMEKTKISKRKTSEINNDSQNKDMPKNKIPIYKITIKGFSSTSLSAEDIFKIISDISGKEPLSLEIYDGQETVGIAEFENRNDCADVIGLLNNIEIDGMILNFEMDDGCIPGGYLIDKCVDCKTYEYERNRGRNDYIKGLFERDDIEKNEIDNLIEIDFDFADKNKIILPEDVLYCNKKKDLKTNTDPFDENENNRKIGLLGTFEKDMKNKNLKNETKNKMKKTRDGSVNKESNVDDESIEFEIDLNDARFEKLFTSDKYRIDPSHSLFKKYKGNQKILEETRKRANLKK